MPTKVPKKRKVVRTINLTNGSKLTAEQDTNNEGVYPRIYWFRNGKYITPNQIKTYKFYDPSIKGYRTLSRDSTVETPVYTPSIDYLKEKDANAVRGGISVKNQSIPIKGQKFITLRTKGKMNLADVPTSMLDSIAVNAGRSGTDFWTDTALIGKESTLGGMSKALHGDHQISNFITDEEGNIEPQFLINNHAYFNSPERDYLYAIYRKYDLSDDKQSADAERNAKYAIDNNLIVDRTPHFSKYILADAFKRYQTNPTKYNPGQSNYVPMLNNIRQELIGEKQLQDYWNTKGKQEYERGKKEGMKVGGRIHLDEIHTSFKDGGSIHIDPSKRGTFTAAATKHGMSVQEYASRVLANKDDYSSAMVKKANFARNASKWNH